MKLEPPPSGATFGQLLQRLAIKGVRPSGQAWKAWTWKDLAYAAGFNDPEGQQVRRYASGKTRPIEKRFKALLQAIFGDDEQYLDEWRVALRCAWEREAPIEELSTYDAEIKTTSEHHGTTPTIPVRVPYHFHGCEGFLNRLHSCLTSGATRVAIYGVHGVGKTTVAAAYANRYASSYASVGWIDATSNERCQLDIARFGTAIGAVSAKANPSQAVQQTLAHVGAAVGPMLLIYDNATNVDAIHPYLPSRGTAHILLTSNSPNWRGEAVPMELSTWSTDTAVTFLKERLGAPFDYNSKKLATELGGLPLALEIAAAYCERRRVDCDFFLDAFSLMPGTAIDTMEAKATSYKRTIRTAIAHSIETAQQEHASAKALLEVMSAFGDAEIPPDVIRYSISYLSNGQQAPLDEMEMINCLAALRNYSLIKHPRSHLIEKYPSRAFISVHPMIRSVALQLHADPIRSFNIAVEALAASHRAKIDRIVQRIDPNTPGYLDFLASILRAASHSTKSVAQSSRPIADPQSAYEARFRLSWQVWQPKLALRTDKSYLIERGLLLGRWLFASSEALTGSIMSQAKRARLSSDNIAILKSKLDQL